MRIRAAAAVFVIATAAAVSVSVGPGATPACAAAVGEGPNRAVVVVQTGARSDSPVTRVCVRFTEDWLSGAEVLRRADVDAVFRPYGGMGEFVCSILGVGPEVDDCPAAEQNWTYFRAVYPATSFRYSSTGVSSTKVYDGDVEGWRFAGSPPPHSSVVDVCGGPEPAARTSAAPTTTTTAASSPAPTTSTTATTAPAIAPAPAVPATSSTVRTTAPPAQPGPGAAAVEAEPATTSTTASSAGTDAPDGARDLAATPTARVRDEDDRGTSLAALVVFLGLLVGLAGWWWRARAR